MRYLVYILLFISLQSKGQAVFGIAYPSTTNLGSEIFNFSATASAATGATNFYGDPTLSPSFTGATTGWILTSVGANWLKYGSSYGGVGNGSPSASSDGVFTQLQGNSNLFGQQVFGTQTYNLQFTNLPPGTYTIELWASIPSATFANGGAMEFHVQFGTGADNYALPDPNGGTGGTGNLVPSGPGTTNVSSGTFTGAITTGQTINIMVSKGQGGGGHTGASGQIGFINALKITRTS